MNVTGILEQFFQARCVLSWENWTCKIMHSCTAVQSQAQGFHKKQLQK